MEPEPYMVQKWYDWKERNALANEWDFLRHFRLVTKFRKFSRGAYNPMTLFMSFLHSFGKYPTPEQAMNNLLNEIENAVPVKFTIGMAAFADLVYLMPEHEPVIVSGDDGEAVSCVDEDGMSRRINREREVQYAHS